MSEIWKKEDTFLNDIRGIINSAKQNAVRSVDFCRVQMYWHMGKRIFEEEQQGKDRADYGTYLIKNLAKQLEPEYGSGFSVRQLAFCRQFYRVYPIANALRSQLNWTQYRMLIQIDDPDKRMYYELESVNNGWTARENLLSASCSAPTKTIQQYAWLYPKIIKPYWQANTNFICLRKHN